MNTRTLLLGLAALWVVAAAVVAGLFLMPTPSAPPIGDGAQAAEAQLAADKLLDTPGPLQADPPGEQITHQEETTLTETPEEAHDETGPKGETQTTASDPNSVLVTQGSAHAPFVMNNVATSRETSLHFGDGEYSISGDVSIMGTVHARDATLVFDGADQTIQRGHITAKRMIFRGGTKRISAWFDTNGQGNDQPGEAGLYVEAGTTLIIETGGKWTTPNPYGFQIAGHLIIDGGEFHCSFSNGNGTDRGEKAWLQGSELTIRSGSFVGAGDADFSGASITIHDGSLEIDDDIWSTGASLTIYGGLMRNSRGGGMFQLTGAVSVTGGELQVHQNGSRSLRIHEEALVYCTGGVVSINGAPARGDNGAILIGASATLPSLKINTTVRIHKDSLPGAYLSVGGDVDIRRGSRFEAAGFNVIASIVESKDQGEFVP